MDFEDAASDALPLALRASWNVPLPIDATSPWLFQLQPEHIFFAVLAILLGTLLAIGAAIMLRRVARPVRSAAATLSLRIISARFRQPEGRRRHIAASLGALTLAGTEMAAVSVARRRRGDWRDRRAGVPTCNATAALAQSMRELAAA